VTGISGAAGCQDHAAAHVGDERGPRGDGGGGLQAGVPANVGAVTLMAGVKQAARRLAFFVGAFGTIARLTGAISLRPSVTS
jgi:hypothetical protein